MQIVGSITALITPFTSAGSLDLAAFDGLLDRQLLGGTQGLVVAGSTGEASALDAVEFTTLIEAAVRRVDGRIPVLAGTGSSSTHTTIARTRLARSAGASHALVVTPPYVRPTQEGLYAHFSAVADAGVLGIVLYNVPSRTGVDLAPETCERLSRHSAIVGVKEAVAEPQRMQSLIPLQRPEFVVLSGDDPTACAAMLAGAGGLISVASNVFPVDMRRLCDAARSGRRTEACAQDALLQPLFAVLATEPNPIPVKAALAELGVCENVLRLPLLPLAAQYRPALRTCLEAMASSGASH